MVCALNNMLYIVETMCSVYEHQISNCNYNCVVKLVFYDIRYCCSKCM